MVVKVVIPEESLPQGIEKEAMNIYTVKLIFDGMKKHIRYILHPRGAIIGDTIVSGIEVPIKIGNALSLSAVHLIFKNYLVIVGQVENVGANQKSLGRAESKHWLGKRPIVREIVMNPIDHAHWGGEGEPQLVEKNPQPFGVILHLEEEVEK
ncbi:hypothetical protein CDL12_06263 [Handroanthus impetiginosus]|uniref:Large ribosomal subunit protein uL2 C-terminal domain-containing protein n=1 Tax=Handroanthus impetiginosus TaxID=429701 RepID=A0A2G9HU46_9LAMI|nr:hypothetical protein CDL12_06263 [Handroanthus impetiginosus]